MTELHAPSLLRDITLQVMLRDMPQLRLRLWLFMALMRLAAWVGGVGGFGGVEFIETHHD